jgi:hypothetical protein
METITIKPPATTQNLLEVHREIVDSIDEETAKPGVYLLAETKKDRFFDIKNYQMHDLALLRRVVGVLPASLVPPTLLGIESVRCRADGCWVVRTWELAEPVQQ